MRILLAATGRAVTFGGGETFIVNLLGALRRRGVDCELFWIGVATKGLNQAYTSNGTLAELVKIILERQIDVVHAGVADWNAGISLLRKMCPQVTLVLTNHGEVYPGWNSQNCDAIVGCSAWTAAAQRAAADMPVSAVLNGIDTERFVPAQRAMSGPPIVGWMGRGASWEKGLDRFAPIAPALKEAGLRIWVADYDGPSKVSPEIARVLGPVADRWEGIPQESMPAFYQDIAASGGCAMLTAYSEGLPLRLLEAQSCGCPVISADIRGANECVDARHGGILYRPDLDPQALAKLVRESLADTEAMKERRQACTDYVREQFNLDRMAAQYMNVYTEAYAAHRSPSHRSRGRSVRVPLREWPGAYWSAAVSQYNAMLEFDRSGQRRLARLAAKESFLTLPTIYLRFSRLSRLFRATIPAMW
jgi:glycosyltransferase involved in cell wall biosynthesis